MKWSLHSTPPRSARRFETLVRPHLAQLFRLAWRFTQSRDDAEDLVQGLLVKLLQQEERLEQVEQLGPWLARALYNLYVDQLRQHRRAEEGLGVRVRDDELVAAVVDEDRESPEQATERMQLNRRLETALAALSTEHRALIALHDVEGYKLHELAEMLSLPVGTLKSRLHRGRAHLRWLLLDTAAAAESESMARARFAV